MAKYTVAALPEPLTPEQGRQLQTIDVEYVSAIHLAQKQGAVAAIQQVFDAAAAMTEKGRPEAMHRVNADKMILKLAELTGCPESCLTDDENVARAVEADKQAAARQAQMVEAEAAANAVKNLGGIPLDENHAGSAIADAMSKGGIA